MAALRLTEECSASIAGEALTACAEASAGADEAVGPVLDEDEFEVSLSTRGVAEVEAVVVEMDMSASLALAAFNLCLLSL
jgi:hypothetical protein